jgi:hypothetical protein
MTDSRNTRVVQSDEAAGISLFGVIYWTIALVYGVGPMIAILCE